MPEHDLVLASASPRRRDLLTAAGVRCHCVSADVDESLLPGESPEAAVCRLARAKAAAIAPRFPAQTVLGADTLVVLDGEALGKPADLEEARAMLRRLAGKTHQVMTGVCLFQVAPARDEAWVAITTVEFHDFDEALIEKYLRHVHVLDKAGGYAMQEYGDWLVRSFRGLATTVIGIPVEEVLLRLG